MLCADKQPVGFRGTSWGSTPLNMVVEMLEIALNIVWGLRRFAAICIAAVAVIEMSAAEPKTTDKGEFKLPPIFSDHMVLQQGAVIPVWGVGPNFNFRLSCRIGDTVTWTQTDSKIKSGHGWDLKFYLPPLKAGGPYEMVITNETTKATLVIRDVMIGEVWLASGQSNMAFSMRQFNQTLPKAEIPALRIFNGKKWIVANKDSVQNLSALATLFGCALNSRLNVPVGILSLSCGGTYAENWMSRGALKACDATRKWTDDYELGLSNPAVWAPNPKRPKDPIPDTGPSKETRDWAKTDFAAADWQDVDEPADFTMAFGRPFNGAVWFRKTVEIPEKWAGRDLLLKLPAIDKHDITWFDGVEVGRTGKDFEWEMWNVKREYTVPGQLVKPGRRTIAVRIWSFKLGGGFMTGADHFSIGPKDADDRIDLEGTWRARIERDIGNLTDNLTINRRPYGDGLSFVRPSSWFDSTLKPIIPYAMRGAVWYQGESNADNLPHARGYGATLGAMIADWRAQWGLGDFPVGVVQLPSFQPARRFLPDCAWAEVRDGQFAVSRSVRNVGLVSALDLGEECNIHPADKLSVANRLCRWAMAEVYGKGEDRPYTGPRFLSGEIEAGGGVRIRFTEAEGGIIATGPVECCVIRGADGVWHPAKVSVDNETLLVAAPEVSDPCEVRYAWAGSPIGATLRGKASNIPVFPFRWVKPATAPINARSSSNASGVSDGKR